MSQTQDIVREQYQSYRNQRARSTPDAAQELAEAILHDIGDDLMVAIDPSQRTFWIQSYIREQKQHPQRRKDEDKGPLCTCNHRCQVTKGEIPREVREAESLSAGLREFHADHPGHPNVIDEAIEAYRELRETVRHRLTIAESILARGHREQLDEYDAYELPADIESPADVLDGIDDRKEAAKS